jgi:starch synthase
LTRIGPDLVLAAAGELSARNIQTVMLGSGVEEFESAMREAERQHPNHFRGWVGFSIPVAHRMIAGCDALLMPSRFEPCGLNQLFSMAYGTVPIAHATGGLRDTIAPFQPDKAGMPECGSGFVFSPPEANAMLQAIDHAVHLFRNDERAWRGLQAAGMAQDLSWEKAAKEYEQLFGWALMDPAVRPW